MFHLRSEGQPCRFGFNFYPWKDRRHSIGFLYMTQAGNVFWCRLAPHVKKFYFRFER